ncbi:hypothetical protein HDZ31DRAFT_70785, partial [Schizophyllum fasciatum]
MMLNLASVLSFEALQPVLRAPLLLSQIARNHRLSPYKKRASRSAPTSPSPPQSDSDYYLPDEAPRIGEQADVEIFSVPCPHLNVYPKSIIYFSAPVGSSFAECDLRDVLRIVLDNLPRFDDQQLKIVVVAHTEDAAGLQEWAHEVATSVVDEYMDTHDLDHVKRAWVWPTVKFILSAVCDADRALAGAFGMGRFRHEGQVRGAAVKQAEEDLATMHGIPRAPLLAGSDEFD